MIRIVIAADRCEELMKLLREYAAEGRSIFEPICRPVTFKDGNRIQYPEGSYRPRHAKTGTADGRPR